MLIAGCTVALSLLQPSALRAQKTNEPAGQTGPSGLPQNARDFKFTKVDLDLLRQVNAFDKYIEERGWVYSEPQINQYLEKIGLTLVPQQTPENVRWRFRAIRDLEANAFALPNGSVYVNSGLLSRIENEAQLAGVMAHEITHVVHRHAYLEYRSSRKKMVAIDLILTAASAAYYTGAGPLVAQAMANLLPVIVSATVFGYSRELEHEADICGVEALQQHGYDLREFSRGFELLRKGPEVDLSRAPVFWSSHPKLTDRVGYVTTMAEQLQPSSAGLLVNRSPYFIASADVMRDNAAQAMLLGRPRTAVAIALRLTAEDPNNAENYVLLGDAYRSLGARTPLPEAAELTDEAKEQARLRMRKMTLAEYDKALLEDERGPERWEVNRNRSQKSFRKALEMDPHNASAHRGLGYLFERSQALQESMSQFREYLELAPQARDARQIKLHLESLEHPSSGLKPQAQKTTRAQ